MTTTVTDTKKAAANGTKAPATTEPKKRTRQPMTELRAMAAVMRLLERVPVKARQRIAAYVAGYEWDQPVLTETNPAQISIPGA
jgi:hypothetical protein